MIDDDSYVSSKGRLATVLRKFYAEAGKKSGELYTKFPLSTGYALPFSDSSGDRRLIPTKIQSFLKTTQYQAEISELQRDGKARTQHKSSMSELYKSGKTSEQSVFLRSCLSSVGEGART